MRRNCNLELTLFPPYDSDDHRHNHIIMEEDNESPMQNYHYQQQLQQEQQQKLTIFYDGKICVADVTELQAKSILMLANKKAEERVRTPTSTGSEPSSPTVVYSPGPGLSMKRSLQRFLQKRKIRVQEASPYNH
ncbi:protein TIFY 5A [Gastrolobium bilobum]|uniref:protein TIFY 5A n=1 Tax=Gastrolobium bilobum TaxID=150636 RepID=UPI002AB23B50|nr:protein TIFY 5A [Gastrolobium bilobum]